MPSLRYQQLQAAPPYLEAIQKTVTQLCAWLTIGPPFGAGTIHARVRLKQLGESTTKLAITPIALR